MSFDLRSPAAAGGNGAGRVRLPLLLEAMARVSFAYLRDQHDFRRRRPLGRYAARNAAFLLAGRRQQYIEAAMGSVRVLVPTSDRTIGRSVFASGDWDPLLVGTVFRALARFGHRVEGTVFMEIGANFGVYALSAVRDLGFTRAVAYEPEPAAFALLEANIARNGLADHVTAINAALSDRPGTVTMTRSIANAGDNRIVGQTEAATLVGRNAVSVRASTFDDEVAEGRIPVSELGLVWLDVQGHEAQVMAGASSLLRAGVPLVLEYSSRMMGRSATDHLEQLVRNHYDCFVDLGWSVLADRVRFHPADQIGMLRRHTVETDLLLLRRR